MFLGVTIYSISQRGNRNKHPVEGLQMEDICNSIVCGVYLVVHTIINGIAGLEAKKFLGTCMYLFG